MNHLSEPGDPQRPASGGWRRFFVGWISTTLGVLIADFLVPGIRHQAFSDLAWVALLLGLMNAFVRPVLLFLTIPFVVVTLGFGFLIINGLLLWMVGSFVPGFTIDGFWSAFFGGVIISFVSSIAAGLMGGNARVRVGGSVRRKPMDPRKGPPGGSGPVIDV